MGGSNSERAGTSSAPEGPPISGAPGPTFGQGQPEGELLLLLAEASPQLIAYVDRDQRYRMVNRAYERWFGQPREEILGKHVRDFVGEHAYQAVRPHVEAALAGDAHTFETELHYRHGGSRYVRIDYVPHRSASGEVLGYFGIIADLTQQKRAEEARRELLEAEQQARRAAERAARRMSQLQRITAALADALTAEAAAGVVLDQGLDATGAAAGAVLVPLEAGAALQVLRSAGFAPGTLEPGHRVDVLPGSALEEALRLGAPLWSGSDHERSATGPAIPIAGAAGAGCAMVPLTAGGRTLGLLGLSFAAAQPFAAEDRELILAMAGECAQALERARLHLEAREADRRKDEFLAMLSHELRNPLAPMLMGLELLRRRAAGTPLDRTAAVVQRQALTITRLVDDLLDVSRVTSGKIALQPERLELSAVITAAVETARPLIEERRHELTVEAAPDLQVDGDRVRLEQVLTNLLNNAAKYTDPGGQIAVTSARAGREARITVRDNGLGVPPDDLPHIFEPFLQARRSLDRSQGGLGIGLTLVKRLVEMHGGRVEARSEGPGCGTELRVWLPLAEPGEPAVDRLTPVNDSPLPAAPSGLRVLVVDDNLDAAESLEAMLRDLGHTVTVAHDGLRALAAAASSPDLILLDIGLPGMDGYEVVRRLRAQPAFAGTRIVAVSGYGQAEDLRRSAEAGFDQHLIKPVSARRLAEIAAGVKERPRG